MSLQLNRVQNVEIEDAAAIDSITVALFDDHTQMRGALAAALSRDPRLTVIAAGGSADEAVCAGAELLPDVILLDLNMPGNGIAAAQRLTRVVPVSKIILLTSGDEAHQIDAALSSGASAFLTKGASIAEIRNAIYRVNRGLSELSPSLAVRLLSTHPLAAPWAAEETELPFDLVEREEQILLRLSQGLTVSEIGESIGLSDAAVEAFISNVLMKVHDSNAAGLFQDV